MIEKEKKKDENYDDDYDKDNNKDKDMKELNEHDDHEKDDKDENEIKTREKFRQSLQFSLAKHLSPDWNPEEEEDQESEEKDVKERVGEYLLLDSQDNLIPLTDIVATELLGYVNAYLTAYQQELYNEPFEESQTHLIESIKLDSSENSNYCRKIANWVHKSHFPLKIQENLHSKAHLQDYLIQEFNTVCDEYMRYSPGPWRECILLETIRGRIFPDLCRELIENVSLQVQTDPIEIIGAEKDLLHLQDTTLSMSVSGDDQSISVSIISGRTAGEQPELKHIDSELPTRDDHIDFDSISSVGFADEEPHQSKKKLPTGSGDSVASANRRSRIPLARESGKMQTVNRLKAEIAMLQDQLVKAESVDKTILQNKLREYRVDLDVLRERNKELSTRVNELDLQLFRAFMEPIQSKLKDTQVERERIKMRERQIEVDDDLLFEDAHEETSQLTATDSEEKSSVVGVVRSNSLESENLGEPKQSAESNSRKQIKEMIVLYEKQFEKMQNEIRYLRILSKRHPTDVPSTVLRLEPYHHSGPVIVNSRQKQEEKIERNIGNEEVSHEKSKNMFTKKQVDRMITEAIQQSKDIDQKTIKEMLHELADLTDQLKVRDDEIKAIKISFKNDQSKINPSNGISQDSNESQNTNSIQKRSGDESQTNQVGFVYAFLFGGIVVMFLTSLIPWCFSFVSSLNSVRDSVQTMDSLEIEEEEIEEM